METVGLYSFKSRFRRHWLRQVKYIRLGDTKYLPQSSSTSKGIVTEERPSVEQPGSFILS